MAGGEVQLAADTFEVSNSVLVYDPRNNTWRSVAPMATARTGLRLVASGRYLYAIGGNADSALLMGLPVARTKVLVYVISGFCAGLCGFKAGP